MCFALVKQDKMANEYDYVIERGHAANSDIDWGAILTINSDEVAKELYKRARFFTDYNKVFRAREEQEKQQPVQHQHIHFHNSSGQGQPGQENLEEKVRKEQEEAEKRKAEEDAREKIRQHAGKKKEKAGDVVSEIKIVPKLLVNKWWGAVPTVAGGTIGLAGGLAAALALPFSLPVIAGVSALTTLAGTYFGSKVPLNKDNWYAQERWGKTFLNSGIPFFGCGQPEGEWFDEDFKNTSIIAEVYKIDYKNAYKRDKRGHRIYDEVIDEKGKKRLVPIPDCGPPKWYNIGKIATKLPQEIDKEAIKEQLFEAELKLIEAGKNEKETQIILKKVEKKLRQMAIRNATEAGFKQYEFLYHDEEENDWNREVINIEDIEHEISRSKSEFGKKYLHENIDGLGCICSSVFINNSRRINVEEMSRPGAKLFGDFFKVPWEFLKDTWRFGPGRASKNALKNTARAFWNIPRYFRITGGRLYATTVYGNDLTLKNTEEEKWFLEKDPIKSILFGNYHDFCDIFDGRAYANMDKSRVWSLLYGALSLGGVRPYYRIKMRDINLSDSKNFVRSLATQSYQLNDKKHNYFRYNYETDEKGKVVPDMNNPKYIEALNESERFRAERLMKR